MPTTFALVEGEDILASAEQVNTMLKDMTRSRLIQGWFAAVVLVVTAGIAFGVAVTVGTGALLAGAGTSFLHYVDTSMT